MNGFTPTDFKNHDEEIRYHKKRLLLEAEGDGDITLYSSPMTHEQLAILENNRNILRLQSQLQTLEKASDCRTKILLKIIKKVQIDAAGGCWTWCGATSGNGRGGGYGRIYHQGQTTAVHRLMAALFFGCIPRKKQVDHTCRNRLCVNPDHLEIVTHIENQRRRDADLEQERMASQ